MEMNKNTKAHFHLIMLHSIMHVIRSRFQYACNKKTISSSNKIKGLFPHVSVSGSHIITMATPYHEIYRGNPSDIHTYIVVTEAY